MATSNDTSKVGYVYLVTNHVNGKRYVGLTKTTLRKRWWAHTGIARRGGKTLMAYAIRKYGEASFTIQVLEEVEDVALLPDRERAWIKELNTFAPNGYNLTSGGDGLHDYVPTAETIAKMLSSRQGYHHSEETKRKISAANKGKCRHPISATQREQVSITHKGRERSPEYREKIRQTLMGHSVSEETREKIRLAQTGKKRGHYSEEHRAKIGAAHKGRAMSEQSRAKINSPEAIAKRAATNRERHAEKRRQKELETETLWQMELWELT